jgi:ribonuclease-3 family protein
LAISPPPDPDAPGPTTDWLRSLRGTAPISELGPQQLAWLGDSVWELHQRLSHCRRPARIQALHRAVVAQVKAEAQARALRHLDPLLSEQERDLVRRGRNAAGRGPRRGEAALYGQASGFETMLGWLFLLNPARLAELLDHLENDDTSP